MNDMISKLTLHFAAAVLCATAAWAAEPRRHHTRQDALPRHRQRTNPNEIVVSLDGTWQIAEGKMEQIPANFDRTVPVPGLVSLATPPFDAPGPKVANRQSMPQKDPQRDAFWYRRTFTLDGPLPAVAKLKVAKAMFGTRVFLNGTLLGDHRAQFHARIFRRQAGAQDRQQRNR